MDPDSYLCRLAELFDGVTVYPPTVGAIIAIILAVLLLFASGFVSASEIAFFSLSPNDLSEIEKEEHSSDRRIMDLLEDSERLLATILISNNFVNVTIIMLCNYFFAEVVDFGSSVIVEFLVITVILTFLLLLFGEIIPKIYSAQHTLAFARFVAPVIMILKKVFSPLSNLLVRSTVIVNKCVAKRNYNISVDDLSQALELTDKTEISEESNILEGIIRFGGETAKEVMTPRLDMVDLEISATFKEVLDCVVENGYSRVPVYEDSRDNIKGILYIKDLLPHLKKDENFQVDEFGGTSGIVTMEDIIEEIVGEINDEYDEEERSYVKVNDHTYVFEAKTLLSDFYKIVKIDSDTFEDIEGDADTLAGLLLEIKGEFPKLHEKLEYEHYQFEVLEMDARRILKIKVIIGEPKKEND